MDFSRELKFAFSDFLTLLKKRKKTVIFFVLIGALGCFLLAVTRPVAFIVQATFRDKGKTQAAIRSSISDMFLSSSTSHDSEAISTMKSKYLVSSVLTKLGKQGFITKVETAYPEIDNAYDNLLAEWGYWLNIKVPLLKDPAAPLQLSQITYPGEVIATYTLKIENNETFSIEGPNGFAKQGKHFGEWIEDGKTRFVVTNPLKTKIVDQDSYNIVLLPLHESAKNYSNLLAMEVDKDDKTLVKILFKDRDRHFAARFVNELMKSYQRYLLEDHELTASVQVNYLEKRQKDVHAELQTLMDGYVQMVADDMARSGFTSLQKEMDFLAMQLSTNQQKMVEIDLEIKRLQNICIDDCVHFDAYTGRQDALIINQLLGEIRALKAEQDLLDVALRPADSATFVEVQKSLEDRFTDLKKFRLAMDETSHLIATVQGKGKSWSASSEAKENPLYAWYAAYQKNKSQAYEFELFKKHFLEYLTHLNRLQHIQLNTLEQRLHHLHSEDEEFQGISLDISQQMLMGFVKELNELQAQEKQHRFIVGQLKNPEFELSSLTALLQDPVSNERIAKTTELMINLKDENNRTQKEKDRIKDELELQKSFLAAHIGQIAELIHLKQELFKEKMKSLQAVTLDLILQKISLVKNQLHEYIKTRIENFKDEKELLASHQISLQARMAEIPSKWASEQLVNQNLAMQQRFLENLANMVESKNITKNLEMIQSSPLDKAEAPISPKPPRLVLYTLFGAVLGFMAASSYLFTKTMLQGIPASFDNLRLANFHTSGYITSFHGDEASATTPLLNADLDTLRRLVAHFEQDLLSKSAKKVLILSGDGPDISNTLAKLFSKKGMRSIKLQLKFNEEKQQTAGLLQYLEGGVSHPTIENFDGFDKIGAGGSSRYSEELLRSPRFMALLDSLSQSYEWTIGVTSIKIPSAEAENLAKIFDGTCVIVTDETLQDLMAFANTLDTDHRKQLTFVMAPKSS